MLKVSRTFGPENIPEYIDPNELEHLRLTKLIEATDAFDPIDRPKHYCSGGIEPIDYIMANKLDFCEGNVVKYVTRHRLKNGVEDLKKARFYLNRLISEYEKELKSE